MSSTAQYPSVTCVVCNQLMTHHRCMEPVKKGLLVIAVVGVVCGKPICGPCNYQHGNEGIFRCPVHSVSDVSSDDDSVAGNKEDAAVILSGKSQITKSGTSGYLAISTNSFATSNIQSFTKESICPNEISLQ